MIAISNERNETSWQTNFVGMLPEIEQRLRRAFRQLDPASKYEAIAKGCCTRCSRTPDCMHGGESKLRRLRAWRSTARARFDAVGLQRAK